MCTEIISHGGQPTRFGGAPQVPRGVVWRELPKESLGVDNDDAPTTKMRRRSRSDDGTELLMIFLK